MTVAADENLHKSFLAAHQHEADRNQTYNPAMEDPKPMKTIPNLSRMQETSARPKNSASSDSSKPDVRSRAPSSPDLFHNDLAHDRYTSSKIRRNSGADLLGLRTASAPVQIQTVNNTRRLSGTDLLGLRPASTSVPIPIRTNVSTRRHSASDMQGLNGNIKVRRLSVGNDIGHESHRAPVDEACKSYRPVRAGWFWLGKAKCKCGDEKAAHTTLHTCKRCGKEFVALYNQSTNKLCQVHDGQVRLIREGAPPQGNKYVWTCCLVSGFAITELQFKAQNLPHSGCHI